MNQALAIGLTALVTVLGSAASTDAVAGAPGPRTTVAVTAPDFARTDLMGRPVRLSDFRGKVVLLSFWATWCAPCLGEIPTFTRWRHTYGPAGLRVVSVSMDDDAAPVQAAVDRYHIAYPVVLGDADLGDRYGGVLGLPLSFLIDRSGRIVERIQGEADLAALERRIRGLLRRATTSRTSP